MPFSHKFGEPNFEQLSQSCLKCGKVIRIDPKPCEHKMVVIQKEDYHSDCGSMPDDSGIVYISHCEKCGEITEDRIATEY